MVIRSQALKSSPIKGKDFSVINVKNMTIYELNVLHISRCRERDWLFHGQKMNLKVTLKHPNMSLPYLEYMKKN